MTYHGWNIQHRGDLIATKGPQRLAATTLQRLKDLMDLSESSPVECAWCDTDMDKTDDCGGTSHGICSTCYARELAAAGLSDD